MNKTALAKQYGCCWRTIDKRLNPEKYKKERKLRVYASMLDPYKNIIDEKIENNNIPSTGIYLLLKTKKQLSLPLANDVGEAIIDYIICFRS